MEKYLTDIIKCILDCLEECLDTMTLAVGRKLLHVFLVTVIIFILSILFQITGMPSFISWIEAAVACGMTGMTYLASYFSRSSINELYSKLMSVRKNIKRDKVGGSYEKGE